MHCAGDALVLWVVCDAVVRCVVCCAADVWCCGCTTYYRGVLYGTVVLWAVVLWCCAVL